MKPMTDTERSALTQAVRKLLNAHDTTSGCDAAILFWRGSPEGPQFGYLTINSPPPISQVCAHLCEFAAAAAYTLGVQDEKTVNDLKAAEKAKG